MGATCVLHVNQNAAAVLSKTYVSLRIKQSNKVCFANLKSGRAECADNVANVSV